MIKLILFASIATASCLQGMKKVFKTNAFPKLLYKTQFANRKNLSNAMRYSIANQLNVDTNEDTSNSGKTGVNLNKKSYTKLFSNEVREKILESSELKRKLLYIGNKFINFGNQLESLGNQKLTYGQKMKKFNDLKRRGRDMLEEATEILPLLSNQHQDDFNNFKKDLDDLKLHHLRVREDK